MPEGGPESSGKKGEVEGVGLFEPHSLSMEELSGTWHPPARLYATRIASQTEKNTEFGGLQSQSCCLYSVVLQILYLISGVKYDFQSEFCLRKITTGSSKTSNEYCSESENSVYRLCIYICSISY